MDVEAQIGTLIVLDDDALFAEKLTRMLRRTQWNVLGFADPEKALNSILSAGAPLALLVDARMPRTDGIAFLQRLRQTEAGNQVHTALMSEVEPQQADQQSLARLNVEFLSKDSLRSPEKLNHFLAQTFESL